MNNNLLQTMNQVPYDQVTFGMDMIVQYTNLISLPRNRYLSRHATLLREERCVTRQLTAVWKTTTSYEIRKIRENYGVLKNLLTIKVVL